MRIALKALFVYLLILLPVGTRPSRSCSAKHLKVHRQFHQCTGQRLGFDNFGRRVSWLFGHS